MNGCVAVPAALHTNSPALCFCANARRFCVKFSKIKGRPEPQIPPEVLSLLVAVA